MFENKERRNINQ